MRESCKIEDSDMIREKVNSGTLYVGGLDIAYHKTDPSLAFVGLSISKLGGPASKNQVRSLCINH